MVSPEANLKNGTDCERSPELNGATEDTFSRDKCAETNGFSGDSTHTLDETA